MDLRNVSIAMLLLCLTYGVLGNNEPLFSQTIQDKLFALLSPSHCARQPKNCTKSRYRSLSGECNNLHSPLWGAAYRRYSRLLDPNYGDGYSSPTKSITGRELPSALELSQKVFGDSIEPDPLFTLLNVPCGQIIAHDMSSGDRTEKSKKEKTNCCTDDGQLITVYQNQTCFPIKISKDGHSSAQCSGLTKTLTDKDLQFCDAHSSQPAEQMTMVSAYMDLSIVYGNSDKEMRAVREYRVGRLKMDRRRGSEYPPACPIKMPDQNCYQTGDPRSNQNPSLTMLQITYAREHNRIADALRKINPCWHDERLFQEARRINIAQYQQTNYHEWLPHFLGGKNMKEHRLIYDKEPIRYINDYNPNVDATVLNEHANAAFRFFHSLILGDMELMSEKRATTDSLLLHMVTNRPKVLEMPPSNYDSFIRGQCTQREKLADANMDPDTRMFAFPANNDLRAMDIQRSRDHGLASYNAYRVRCGLRRAKHWNDFSDEIPQEKINILQGLYEDVDDVDLMVGGSLEKFVDNALVGPTFLCIMLEQFYRTRVGDRYFFESGYDKNIRFTIEQLKELKKATVARLMCDNGNNIKKMQPHVFIIISEKNKLDDCSKLPVVDLKAWKDYKCDRNA